MEVILMQSVDNLGSMGDTVTVPRGYARNFLIPKGLAVAASEGARKVVEEHMRLHGVGVIHGGTNSLRYTPHFAITSEEVDLIVEGTRAALTASEPVGA